MVSPRSSRRAAPAWAWAAVLVALAHGIIAYLCVRFMPRPQGLAVVWLANSVSAAGLIRFGTRFPLPFLLGTSLANLLGNLLAGNTLAPSAAFAAVNTLEVGLLSFSWTLLHRRFPRWAESSLPIVVTLTAGVSAGLTALVGAAVPVFAYGAPFWQSVRIWWIADAVGALLVLPLLGAYLSSARDSLPAGQRRAWGEVLALALTFLLLSGWFAQVPPQAGQDALHNVYLFYPLLLWAAVRFGLRGATTATALVAAIAVWDTLRDGAVLQRDGALTNQVLGVQLFCAVSQITVLTVAGVIAAQRRAEGLLAERAHLAALSATVSGALAHGEDLPQMLEQCARHVQDGFGAAFVRIWTLAEGEDVLLLRASAGCYTHLDGPHGRVPLGKLKIGRIAALRRPHLTNELLTDPELSDPAWARAEGMVAFAGLPLALEGRTVGVLALFSRSPLSAAHLQSLATLADDIAVGIERVRKTEQLLLATRAAEAANQAKSEFLANMSHEIRTPLTAILGFTESLLEAPDLSAEHLRDLRVVHRNGDHLLAVLNDILDLSKIEAGHLTLERVPCAPHRLLRDIIQLLQARADEHQVTLRWQQDGPLPEVVLTDPTRLRQVLLNLLGNAIKFTKNGSVSVTASLRAAEERLCFDVEDSGLGISKEEALRLFQPFSQADGSTTRRFGGTGLGLTISRRLARMLGGEVELLWSQPGRGSCFRLTITSGSLSGVALRPADAPARSRPAAAPVQVVALTGARILLAEDGADNQVLVSAILRKAGAEVVIAEDGQRATELALAPGARRFDAILMDMQMPVMDGYAATSYLRRSGYQGPIIALTANAMAQDRERCLDAGCSGYSSKPVNRAHLLRTLAEQLAAPAAP